MELVEALKMANGVKDNLSPYCKRIEIGGSIRRECWEVNDIEIVLIPDTSKLYEYKRAIEQYSKIKGDPLGKYTQRRHPSGVKIDFFICTPETWGCVYFIRTGSASFVYNVMRRLKANGPWFREGRLWQDLPLETPEEEHVFRVLDLAIGLAWVEPRDRC
jgi:DNA polymerase/3'-5' exonuclease PolX